MAYSRRRRTKRRFKRRAYRKRRSTKVGRRFAKKVKKILNNAVETKYVEFFDMAPVTGKAFSITSNPSPDPLWTPLRTVGQGVARNQRIGNKIKVKSIQIRGLLDGGVSDATDIGDDKFNYVRFLAFWAPPAISTSLGPTAVPTWYTQIRKSDYPQFHSFKIDKKFFLQNSIVGPTETGVAYSPRLRPFKFYIPINKTITYVNDVENSVANSDLFCYWVSDSDLPPSPSIIWWRIIVKYTDA